MRLVDVVVAFPFLVLVIALVFVLGSGATSIVIAITAVGWVSYARIVRGRSSFRSASITCSRPGRPGSRTRASSADTCSRT